MSDPGAFLAAILPSLIDLGRTLFTYSGGNPTKARKHIRAQMTVLKYRRAEIDAAAKRKFRR